MTVRYFDDSASGANNGTSWTDAYTSIETSHTNMVAGDIGWVASTHDETPGANATLAAVTNDDITPIAYISMNTATDAQLDGATFGPNAAVRDLTMAWSGVSVGMHWQASDQLSLSGDAVHKLVRGSLSLLGGTSSDTIAVTGDDSVFICDGTQFSFGHASQRLQLSGRGGWRLLRNCSLKSGTTAINDFLTTNNSLTGHTIIEGMDLSLGNTGCSIVQQVPSTMSAGAGNIIKIFGVKLPTSGTVMGTATMATFGSRVEAYGVSTGTNENGLYITDRAGTLTEDTSVYLDDDDLQSWQIDAAAPGVARIAPFIVDLPAVHSTANPTLTVHVTEDNATGLNDDELWIEVDYPDATTPTIRKSATTRTFTDVDNAAVGTEADPGWTGTGGFSNAKYYSIPITVSGGGEGLHRIRLGFGVGATRTIYVDPVVDVS